jgi:hypothetical protein
VAYLDEQCEGNFCTAYTAPAMLCGHQFLWSDSGDAYTARRRLKIYTNVYLKDMNKTG